MRPYLLALLCFSFLSAAEAANTLSKSLLDVASPEEISEELGLAPMVDFSARYGLAPAALSDHNQMARLDLTQAFPVVIVVNKSATGPNSQTVKVYHRGALAYQFATSTGREQWEDAKSGRKYFSVTSVGWYAPTRTYEKYYSETWKAWMNNSVFFNGGLALHATTPDHFKELGKRASGGCVRLLPKNAKIIYDLVLSEGKGQVPVYTWDGQIQRGAFGRVAMHEGWNTLIIVEDNPN